MLINGHEIIIIYIYTSPSGKRYCGQTEETLEVRARGGAGYKNCRYFWHAIQKYGWENFTVEVICLAIGFESANELEDYFIELYDLTNPEKGYNIRKGGSNGKHSEESKRLISQSKMGHSVSEETRKVLAEHASKQVHTPESRAKRSKSMTGKNIGRHHSDETKAKISKAGIGREKSAETRRKISEANSGENHPFYGKTHSDETKKKLSEAGKGRPAWNKGKVQANLTDEDIREIRKSHGEGVSRADLAKKYGCSIGTIRRVILRLDCFDRDD